MTFEADFQLEMDRGGCDDILIILGEITLKQVCKQVTLCTSNEILIYRRMYSNFPLKLKCYLIYCRIRFLFVIYLCYISLHI